MLIVVVDEKNNIEKIEKLRTEISEKISIEIGVLLSNEDDFPLLTIVKSLFI